MTTPDDTLKWINREGVPHRARNHADTGTYYVYRFTQFKHDDFVASFDPDRGPWDSGSSIEIYCEPASSGSLDAAITAAQGHHNAACRAHRWAEYMRDNEPPTAGERR